MSLAQKLDYLASRKDAWSYGLPKLVTSYEVSVDDKPVYDTHGGTCILSLKERRQLYGLSPLFHPLQNLGQVSPISFELPAEAIDVTFGLNENDLMAVLLLEHYVEDEKPLYDPPIMQSKISLSFLRYSTGSIYDPNVHKISLGECYCPDPEWCPSASMEIAGNLIVVFTDVWYVSMDGSGPMRSRGFYVIDWRRGEIKKELPGGPFGAPTFIAGDLLCLVNLKRATLELFHLDTSFFEASLPSPCLILHLPEVNSERAVMTDSCSRCDPNPQKNVAPSLTMLSRPFLNDPEDALIHLRFFFQLQNLPDDPPENRPVVTLFSMYTHRSTIRTLYDDYCVTRSLTAGLQNGSCISVPWDKWGPPNVRMVPADRSAAGWMATTCGQRTMSYSSNNPFYEGVVDVFEIMDFNKAHIREFAAREKYPNLWAKDETFKVKKGGDVILQTKGGRQTALVRADKNSMLDKYGCFKESVYSHLPFLLTNWTGFVGKISSSCNESGGVPSSQFGVDTPSSEEDMMYAGYLGILMDEEKLIALVSGFKKAGFVQYNNPADALQRQDEEDEETFIDIIQFTLDT